MVSITSEPWGLPDFRHQRFRFLPKRKVLTYIDTKVLLTGWVITSRTTNSVKNFSHFKHLKLIVSSLFMKNVPTIIGWETLPHSPLTLKQLLFVTVVVDSGSTGLWPIFYHSRPCSTYWPSKRPFRFSVQTILNPVVRRGTISSSLTRGDGRVNYYSQPRDKGPLKGVDGSRPLIEH